MGATITDAPLSGLEPDEREWRTYQGGPNKGRQYYPNPGRGVVWRHGDETVESALARARVKKVEREERKRDREREREEPEAPRGKGRRRDPTPRSKPEPERQRPSTEQLARAVEVPLMIFPTLVMLQTGCAWCAAEMNARRHAAALELAAMAKTNEYARRALEALYGLISSVSGTENLGRFFGTPLLHHAAPPALFDLAAPLTGMPPRAEPHQHGPEASPRAAEGDGSAPPMSDAVFMRWLAERQRARPRTNTPPYSATAAHTQPPMSQQDFERMNEIRRREQDRAHDPTAPPAPDGANSAGSPLPPDAL